MKADLRRTYAGVGRASIGTKGRLSDLAKPVKREARDVDGGGLKDLVSFDQKLLYNFDAAKYLWRVLIETQGCKACRSAPRAPPSEVPPISSL